MKGSYSWMIYWCHLQAISIVVLNECIEFVSSLVKTLAYSSTFWDCKGENVRPVIEGYFIELLETGENIFGLETVAQIVCATKDDYPIIFSFGGSLFIFLMFRLVVLRVLGQKIKYVCIHGNRNEGIIITWVT